MTPRLVPFSPAALFALLSALLLAAGCSDEATSSGNDNADAKGGKKPVPPEQLLLETDAEPGEVQAGQSFVVKCRTFEPGEGGLEVPLPAPATIDIEGPAPLESANGTTLVFQKVGTYKIRCSVPKYNLVDPEPAQLDVLPGPAQALETEIVGLAGEPPATEPITQIQAGTALQVACTAADKYKNPITKGFAVSVIPKPLVPTKGLVVSPTAVGQNQIACQVSGITDPTPYLLEVVPNVPVHLYAVLDPPTIQAGSAANLSCVANDAYNNPIADFPFALDYPDTVKVQGLWVAATKSGTHTVRCVPETLAWDLFTLHPANLEVLPGPPDSLEVQIIPNKQVYKRDEKVQFLAAVRDVYLNLIPTETTTLGVSQPAKGWKKLNDTTIRFALDGVFKVDVGVVSTPDLAKQIDITVDGTPPSLTIEYPPWGSTVDGKPSVPVQGAAGDETSGIDKVAVNGASAKVGVKACQMDADCNNGVCNPETGYCTIGTWTYQYGAKHGLNTIEATAKDISGETARATRGFYYSGKYYPMVYETPEANLVPDGLQVFVGKDFLDDGVHDPKNPNDLATLVEVAIAGMDIMSLLPPLSQGDIEVNISDLKFDKPTIRLMPKGKCNLLNPQETCSDGGLLLEFKLTNMSMKVAVKAKQVVIIPITVKASGTVTMKALTISTTIKMNVINGQPKVTIDKGTTQAQISSLEVNLDGLLGLLDFIVNAIVDGFEKDIKDQVVLALEQQIPPLMTDALKMLAINQAIPLPALLEGMPTATISLVSRLKTMKWSDMGGLVLLDAGFVAPKGHTHNQVLGSIGRSGCIGTVEDKFQMDIKQRLQIALADDVLNQALHAIWHAGTLKFDKLLLSALGVGGDGSASPIPGFSLDGAWINADLFLPPILETCGTPTPDDVRLQVGDAYAEIVLPLGSVPLVIGLFASVDIGASMKLSKNAAGNQTLSIAVDPALQFLYEIVSITADYEGLKDSLPGIIDGLLKDQLSSGLSGIGDLSLELPPTDLSTLLPGLPLGAKISFVLQNLQRGLGYTTVTAAFE